MDGHYAIEEMENRAEAAVVGQEGYEDSSSDNGSDTQANEAETTRDSERDGRKTWSPKSASKPSASKDYIRKHLRRCGRDL